MSWGGVNRPKVTTKLGRPIDKDGADGDIQIKGTGLGAKLFAKWSGRWWDVPLSINGVTKIGIIDSDYLSIDRDSVDIYKNSVKVAEFGSDIVLGGDGTVTVGEVAVSKSNIHITAGAIQLRNNTSAKLTMDTSGDIAITGKITYNAGDNNIIIAGDSGTATITGGNNCFIGEGAGKINTAGLSNMAIGTNAMKDNVNGKQNICIGHTAGDSIVGTIDGNDGSHNICIGISTGSTITTGNDCTIVGYNAEPSAVGTDNEVVIGASAAGTGANEVALGNTSISTIAGQVSFGTYSDSRIKHSIIDTDIGLDFIKLLRPVKYKRVNPADYPEPLLENKFKDGGEVRLADNDSYCDGLVAQEVKAVCDDLGVTFSAWDEAKSNGKQRLQYAVFVTPLIKAVQELSVKLDTMQTEINNLKAE